MADRRTSSLDTTVDDFVNAVAGIEAGTVTVGVHRMNRERLIVVDVPYVVHSADAVVETAEEPVGELREARREVRTEVAPRVVAPAPAPVPVVPPVVPAPGPVRVVPVPVPQPAPAVEPQPRRPGGILPRPRARR